MALVPDGTGAYELSKMAIAPELRGQGAGRTLLSAAIDHAAGLGASSLFLGSSRKLANAVHLYEALGFEHVAPETLHMPYARADVFMQLVARARPSSPRRSPAGRVGTDRLSRPSPSRRPSRGWRGA